MRKNQVAKIDGGAVFQAPLYLYCDYLRGCFQAIDTAGPRKFCGVSFAALFRELRRIRAARLTHFREQSPQLLVIVNDLSLLSVLVSKYCTDAQSTGEKISNGATHQLEIRTPEFLFRNFNFIANSRPEALCKFFNTENPVEAMAAFVIKISSGKEYRSRWTLANITKKAFFGNIRGELWEEMKKEQVLFHAATHYRDMFAGSKSGALLKFRGTEHRHIIRDVESYDKKSAYPSVLVNDDKFPLSRPIRVVTGKADALINAIREKHWFKIVLRTDRTVPELIPFQDSDNPQLYGIEYYDFFLMRDVLSIPLRRFVEILNGAEWSLYTAKHTGYLADCFRRKIASAFLIKNAISDKSNFYRFTLKTQLDMINGKALQDKHFRTLRQINKYYTGRGENYLMPQHAMHSIAAVRYELMRAVKMLGSSCIAYDTDGIKSTRSGIFDALNEEIRIKNERAGFPKSEIGFWMHEWTAERFLQLCTKSYIYDAGDRITVKHAGISDDDFSRYAEAITGDIMEHFLEPREITVKGKYLYREDTDTFYRQLSKFTL